MRTDVGVAWRDHNTQLLQMRAQTRKTYVQMLDEGRPRPRLLQSTARNMQDLRLNEGLHRGTSIPLWAKVAVLGQIMARSVAWSEIQRFACSISARLGEHVSSWPALPVL